MSSVGIPHNPYYEPVVANRFFEKHAKYEEIERNRHDLLRLVDAFDRRLRGWYVEPIEHLFQHPDPGHFSFAVTAMTCLLIDTLSQYRYGELSSAGRHFKQFVKDCLPSYSGTLGLTLWHFDHGNFQTGKELTDYSDVLWHGFRCGILHQAHAPLYCGINPGSNPPVIETTNHANYSVGTTAALNGLDCPVVIIYPEHLFHEVMTSFSDYVKNLKINDRSHDVLRAGFKKKFSDSFGIDITAATL